VGRDARLGDPRQYRGPGTLRGGQGTIYFDTALNKFMVSENAGTYVAFSTPAASSLRPATP